VNGNALKKYYVCSQTVKFIEMSSILDYERGGNIEILVLVFSLMMLKEK
jgi:hypothetical protein